MSDLTKIDYSETAFQDIERLNDFSIDQDNAVRGQLAKSLAQAIDILAIQPGIGRPVNNGYRELIIHRGRSGYLVRYRYERDKGIVTILRIRHQSETGYTIDEI